jgi:hypothetical protein
VPVQLANRRAPLAMLNFPPRGIDTRNVRAPPCASTRMRELALP